MTNDELKKKIMDILVNCKSDECAVEYCADCEGNPSIEHCREKQQADALIAAGLTFEPIVIRTVELPDECEKKINDILKEEEAIIEEVAHRAERAEKALMTVCVNVVTDEEDDIAVEPRARVLYKAYLKQAKKELEEEKEDD